MRRSDRLQASLRQARQLDREWIGKVPADDPECTPWMPFPMDAFVSMTYEAMPEIEGDRFLEIGCGAGSKLIVARDLFGLDAFGFDRVPAYVAAARSAGVNATVDDARTFPGYRHADLIWCNRVFTHGPLQRGLEETVYEQAAQGTVLMCANYEIKPPSSWFMIMEDDGVRRGIWQKPSPAWSRPASG